MKSLWSVGMVSLLALALFVAAPVQAMYEDVEFTVVLEDGEGDQGAVAGDFYDVRALAIGEPGDETLVFKTTVQDASDKQDQLSSVRVDFEVKGASYFFSFKPDGTKADGKADSCSLAGNDVFCVVKYADIDGAEPGDTVSKITVASKFVTDADTATTETTYTITGGEVAPTVEEVDLDDAEAVIDETFEEAVTKTVVYTWENTFDAIEIAFNVTVDNGTLDVKIGANNTTLAGKSFDDAESGALPLDGAPKGEWTISFAYTDFVGTVAVSVTELSGADPTDGTGEQVDTTGGETATNGTADLGGKETKDSPAVGLVPVALVLGGLVALRRRR
ncbi:MAG: hypothetical protein KY455_01445 [Euryarchaeota archaeon]|nr:hypothetical protein [Euryarchaeota archaeon]